MQRISIDEAFLDMTGTEKLWGEPEAAARLIKRKVRERTALGVSLGIAPNRYVAKIASGLRKPDGLVIVKPSELEAFMLELPLQKLWGAGGKTQERFSELGIRTVAQLAALGEAQLESLFGKAGGAFLYDAVRGRDVGLLGAGEPGSRSMSAETTFEKDCSEREQVEDVLLALAEELAYRLWAEGSKSRTLALKLRFHDFTTISRRTTRSGWYPSSGEAFKDADRPPRQGLGREDRAAPARALLRRPGEEKARLRESSSRTCPSGASKAESAVFEIERKGLGKVTRARLLARGSRGRTDSEEG